MKNRPLLILISGYVKSGKDTVANIIKDNYKNFSINWFALELKKEVSLKYDIPFELTMSHSGKDSILSNGKTVRELLIQESKEQKMYDPYVYIKKLLHNLDKDKDYVIPDFRFPDEFHYINELKMYDIITIRINRYSISSISSLSEYMLDDWNFDYVVENNASLYELSSKVLDIVRLYFI